MKGEITDCYLYQTLSIHDTPSELGMPIKIKANNVFVETFNKTPCVSKHLRSIQTNQKI